MTTYNRTPRYDLNQIVQNIQGKKGADGGIQKIFEQLAQALGQSFDHNQAKQEQAKPAPATSVTIEQGKDGVNIKTSAKGVDPGSIPGLTQTGSGQFVGTPAPQQQQVDPMNVSFKDALSAGAAGFQMGPTNYRGSGLQNITNFMSSVARGKQGIRAGRADAAGKQQATQEKKDEAFFASQRKLDEIGYKSQVDTQKALTVEGAKQVGRKDLQTQKDTAAAKRANVTMLAPSLGALSKTGGSYINQGAVDVGAIEASASRLTEDQLKSYGGKEMYVRTLVAGAQDAILGIEKDLLDAEFTQARIGKIKNDISGVGGARVLETIEEGRIIGRYNDSLVTSREKARTDPEFDSSNVFEEVSKTTASSGLYNSPEINRIVDYNYMSAGRDALRDIEGDTKKTNALMSNSSALQKMAKEQGVEASDITGPLRTDLASRADRIAGVFIDKIRSDPDATDRWKEAFFRDNKSIKPGSLEAVARFDDWMKLALKEKIYLAGRTIDFNPDTTMKNIGNPYYFSSSLQRLDNLNLEMTEKQKKVEEGKIVAGKFDKRKPKRDYTFLKAF